MAGQSRQTPDLTQDDVASNGLRQRAYVRSAGPIFRAGASGAADDGVHALPSGDSPVGPGAPRKGRTACRSRAGPGRVRTPPEPSTPRTRPSAGAARVGRNTIRLV